MLLNRVFCTILAAGLAFGAAVVPNASSKRYLEDKKIKEAAVDYIEANSFEKAPEYISIECGTWAGKLVPEELPDSVRCDWVRVYQKVK